MNQINNLPQFMPAENSSLISFNPALAANQASPVFINDPAFSFESVYSSSMSRFDMITDNFAAFKDMISTAYDGVSAMKSEGEGIRMLIAQAKEEGITPELLDKIQAEVDSRLENIKNIKNSVFYNGVNPFNGSFSLDVPDWQSYIGAENKEEAESEIKDIIASFDIDMTIEGDGFSIGGSAKINIGVNDEGALQITVDANMDYDLSGLLDKGVSSDEAMDMINEFLNMLGVTQNDFGTTLNMLDSIWGKTIDSIENRDNSLEITPDSSSSLKGHIAQQASITLDGYANQSPNISINIL